MQAFPWLRLVASLREPISRFLLHQSNLSAL